MSATENMRQWLRDRILSHGKTRQTDAGPQYVGCRCNRCVNDRAQLAALSKATGTTT